jgi:copper chaperone CopZ
MARTVTIPVSEIHCESCENTIRVALSRLDGVLQVMPSAQANHVRVSYDETRVGEDGLRATLAELGYQPVS